MDEDGGTGPGRRSGSARGGSTPGRSRARRAAPRSSGGAKVAAARAAGRFPIIEPDGAVRLAFEDPAVFAHVSDPFAEDLSALARIGDSLFLSCDETASVERLTREAEGEWGAHRHFLLGEIFDLPDGLSGEMDIEGLAAEEGWLWIVGSHSLKRGKPEGTGFGDMAEIKRDPNRAFLGRLPLVERAPGVFEPVAADGERKAAALRIRKSSSQLKRWLSDDPLLAPFLKLPSKENGFDVEGLAVRGDRVFLGLRGPVIGSRAVIVELSLKEKKGRLKARRIDGDRRYRLHLLPSDGLGVRDLAVAGDDLIVLLGPVSSGHGVARLLRWRDGLAERPGGVAAPEAATPIGALPFRGEHDQPEGLAPWPEGGADRWIVVCDSPSPERVDAKAHAIRADLVTLPGIVGSANRGGA